MLGGCYPTPPTGIFYGMFRQFIQFLSSFPPHHAGVWVQGHVCRNKCIRKAIFDHAHRSRYQAHCIEEV